MNSSSTEHLLTGFLNKVESLLQQFNSLKARVDSLRDKVESLKERNEELQQKNSKLKETIDRQRLEFSELAGELEVKFDRIKDEAGSLLSESQE